MNRQQRTLVLMFADVSGSARLYERLGDSEAAYAVERCLKRMNRAIEGFGGRTVQVVGDELLAVFDAPDVACHAAVDMQLRIADLPPMSGAKLAIRIGLHYGEVTDTGDELLGDSVGNAARVAGMARSDQILCSSTLVAGLPETSSIKLWPMPDLGTIQQDGMSFAISLLEWMAPPAAGQTKPPDQPAGSERLCLRYRGKAYWLDERIQVLTLGRDPGSKILVSDRKASRMHARIERRADGFHFVDTSTNGSFVRFLGKQEIMVRRYEILLEGKGNISFGSSLNDPNADFIEFEHV